MILRRKGEYGKKEREANAKRYQENPQVFIERAIDWRFEHLDAGAAHEAVREALLHNTITQNKTCQRCGKPCETKAFHKDYRKRLDVEWLCGRCHRKACINRGGHNVGKK
jgi:hypothetical protein